MLRDYTPVKIDYCTNGYTLEELAIKYNIPLQTLKNQSTANHWVEERKKYKTRLEQDSIDIIINSKNGQERDERVKAFKLVLHKLLQQLKKGNYKVKSKEGLIGALKSVSEHLELLEGNPTENINLQTTERKSRLDKLIDASN
jgi:hypothetical protein